MGVGWNFAEAKEAHILVTGYSNVAVDNIFLGLRAMGVAALRVRSAGGALVGTNELAAVPGTIQYELSRHQKTHLAASLRSQRKTDQARKYEREAAREIITAAEVVCATCVTAGGDLLASCHFSHVLVDEATQSTESATLIPIVRGCHTLVLIGDQQQVKSIQRAHSPLGLATLIERCSDVRCRRPRS